MTKKEPGYVYILTNPSFREDWVKIGMTRNMEERLRTLDTTALPLPFEKYATLKTVKYQVAEKHVHHSIERFTNLRIRSNREFFNVKPEDALDIFFEVAELLDDALIEVFGENAEKCYRQLVKKYGRHEDIPNEKPDINTTNNEDGKPRLSSLKTLPSYFNNVNSSFTKEVMNSIGLSIDISEVSDISVLVRIRKAIKVEEKKRNMHSTHSCALSRYIDYLNAGLTYNDFKYDAMLIKASKKR